MSLSQPKKLVEFLQELGIQPKKSMSQNFLIDGNIMRKIVNAADVQEGDCILEIGPGPGVLTEAFIERKAHVIAVEKDDLFAQHLPRLDPTGEYLTVFNEDVLKFPIESVLKQHLKPNQKAKVISNLPYQLTSPILGLVLPKHDLIQSVTVMVQKELADRMSAKKDSADYSSLSVFIEFYSVAKKLFNVSPQCFYPAPKVTSAVVRCDLTQPHSNIDVDLFFKIVKAGFNQRRKMLTTSLKDLYPDFNLAALLEELAINPKARPENLNLQEWIILSQKLPSSH